MATPRSVQSILDQRRNDPWLLGLDSRRFWLELQQRIQTLEAQPSTIRVLVADSDPVRFLSGFLATCATGHPVFLGHAGWSEPEWETAVQVVQPGLIWSDRPAASPSPRGADWLDDMVAPIGIPTGGTSGQLRFVIHTWDTLLASVQGMQAHFGVDTIHSYCVLPLYHVSGLMQAVRSLVTGGCLAIASPKDLATLSLDTEPQHSFLSLVPTQLQRLLEQSNRLTEFTQFRAILLGGAPAWPALLTQARQHDLPIAPTYGMTETASQVVTLHPTDFLAGADHLGQSLPHADLQILDQEGRNLGANQVGRLQIRAESLAWGYYPGEKWRSRAFLTDDLGRLDGAGHLTVIGRHSNTIITGGEKVYPAEVEAVILATGQVADVAVIGLPDATWGEVVTAVYVPHSARDRGEAIAPLLRSQLSTFKLPKRWIAQIRLPRNAQGKLNRTALHQHILASEHLGSNPIDPAAIAPPCHTATESKTSP